MPTAPDSLLGRLARAVQPRRPWLRLTVSPFWARVLIAAGAQPAAAPDRMAVAFPPPASPPRLTGRGIKSPRSRKDLRRANLTSARLIAGNLTSARLNGANLTDANLTSADLTDADLNGANLTRANLTDADLTGANLTGANLTGANLTRAVLALAVWDEQTQWPTAAWVERLRRASERLPDGRWLVRAEGTSEDSDALTPTPV